MWQVVNESGGTAYNHFHNRHGERLGFDVCGKTGTATVPPQREDSDGDGRITSRDRIVRTGNMTWFIGFAPYRNPKIAFAVVAEYVPGGHGGSTAGPIAADAMVHLKRMGYLPGRANDE